MDVTSVPVTVDLSTPVYEKMLTLVGGDLPPAQKIGSLVNGLVQDFSEGGLMLSGEDVKRIQEVCPGAGPEEIITAVEEQGGMEDGQVVVKFYVDPTLVDPLQKIGDVQGNTVEEVVQNMMDHAINEGWFYSLEAMPKALFVDQDDYKLIAKAMGVKDPTGSDLVRWLKENGLAEESVQDAIDLFKVSEEDEGDKQLQLTDGTEKQEQVTA